MKAGLIINIRLRSILMLLLGAGLFPSLGAMAQEEGEEIVLACARKNLPMVYVPAAEKVTKILNGYYKRDLRDNRDE